MAKKARYLDEEAEIDLHKVRYFLAVAHHLHFGRAADEMFIAQPALSRAIRALEDDLGGPLFDRDHHHVELTDAGKVFVGEAEALLTRAAATRRRVRTALTPSAALTIGFRPGIIVTDVVQRFTREHPGVAVVAHRIEWDEQDAAVLDGRLDVAWVRTPIAETGLRIAPLFDDPEMIALPVGHYLADRERVRLTDLKREPMLRYDTAPPHHTGREATVPGLRTMEEKLEAVALGHGLAFVPASAASYYQRPDIVYLPVVDAPPYGVALATLAGQAEGPEIDWFVKIAADHYHVA